MLKTGDVMNVACLTSRFPFFQSTQPRMTTDCTEVANRRTSTTKSFFFVFVFCVWGGRPHNSGKVGASDQQIMLIITIVIITSITGIFIIQASASATVGPAATLHLDKLGLCDLWNMSTGFLHYNSTVTTCQEMSMTRSCLQVSSCAL